MIYPVESIVWTDSTFYRDGWVEVDEVESAVGFMEITTVGYVVHENDDEVYVAHSVSDGMCLGLMSIPTGCVLSREIVIEGSDDE